MPDKDAFVQHMIETLGLKALPTEGGLFCQSYTSPETFPAGTLTYPFVREDKPFCTAIYYLLTGEPGSFSALHRLPTDEIWHFYLGDPLEMTLLFEDGSSQQVILGQDILHGQRVQFSVPRGAWQGSRLVEGGHFALVGTTIAPGFTPSDYEGGIREELVARYPQERERIVALTR